MGKHLPCPVISEYQLPIIVTGFRTHDHSRKVMCCTCCKVDIGVGKNEQRF